MIEIADPLILRLGRLNSQRVTAELRLDPKAPISLHIEALETWLAELRTKHSVRQLELEQNGVVDLAAHRDREAHG
jgi:hypothetical protein